MLARRRLADAATGRENNIDAIRLALAALVLYSHGYPLSGQAEREPLSVLTGGQTTLGEVAVDGFFLLSGFLIAQSWLRSRGLGDFLWKRALRIYPGFLAACAFGAAVVGPLGGGPGYWRQFPWASAAAAAVNLDLPATPPVFTTNPLPGALNGSLWTIRYEFLCYLGVAALGVSGLLRRRWAVAALFAAALGVYAVETVLGFDCKWRACYWASRVAHFDVGAAASSAIGALRYWPRLATCFLAGTVFYLFRDRVVLSWWGFAAASLGLAVAGGMPAARAFPPAFPVLGGYAFFFAAFTPWRPLVVAARRGDLSYGVYLYAFLVQQLCVFWTAAALSPPALFAVCLPPTLALAFLSWHLVEKPCLRLKGSAFGRKPALPAGVPTT